MENASSSSSDVRLKSKSRTHRQRQGKKYIKTHHREVSSCAIIMWSFSLDESALPHLKESHRWRQLKNQHVVVAHNFRIERKTSLTQTRVADFARPSHAWEPEGPRPAGYAGVRLGENASPRASSRRKRPHVGTPRAADSCKRSRRRSPGQSRVHHSRVQNLQLAEIQATQPTSIPSVRRAAVRRPGQSCASRAVLLTALQLARARKPRCGPDFPSCEVRGLAR